ncbi:MAG TPA: fibronectin type III domain-containing protein [Verrucomicrobiae bacterium]|nr:fibronectin type III domain-containing protein [Verrucomicrobiae bacterium]
MIRAIRSLTVLIVSSLAIWNVHARSVTLAWDPSPDAVVGYKLYSAISGTTQVGITDVRSATSAVVDNLLDGQTYVFYATAYDTNSVESEPSNQLLYSTGGGSQPTNRPPTMASIPTQLAAEGMLLQFTVSASDPDAGQALSYTLSNAPAGAVINTSSGVFSWSPSASQTPSTNNITITVADNASTPLRVSQTFQVVARAGYVLSVASSQYGTVQISPLGSLNTAGTKYVSGTTVTATARAANGYKFSNWLLDGGSYSQNPLSFAIANNRTLVPYFSRGSKVLASTQ